MTYMRTGTPEWEFKPSSHPSLGTSIQMALQAGKNQFLVLRSLLNT